ncbi:hypothetical protein CORC01_04219 [Colletotrichum orchidophilum]|uniref:Cyanovirin-N domain-containing protein n=1 Tax=Colletotrichum orchidophilum TaxID=1209926 RepID=A0A1G4BGF8_9PEZI|nr:uncharacterized protein CORC01_04219 [Colletotrichum orchidophilum]OHF00469.1 hypothetical protein CORC01_04219 [Colletotrichum orchidophilum]
MHLSSLIVVTLATMTSIAIAKGGGPAKVAMPPSDSPELCLKRLNTYPNRSPKRIDLLGGRCVQGRTYKGKFGPYNGDFFFETCCTDKDGNFGEPTFINVDECIVFDPVNGTLAWNNQNSHEIRDHCGMCEVDGMLFAKDGFPAGPYLSCDCKKDNNEVVKAKIGLGVDLDASKEPKDELWVTEAGKLSCKKQ